MNENSKMPTTGANNIIKPSVLSQPSQSSQSSQPSQPPDQDTPRSSQLQNSFELQSLIASIVSQVLASQGPTLMRNYMNPNAELATATDQNIDSQYRNNLAELDKIPDIVRCLREFSGNPAEFSSWKKSVDRVLKIYEHTKGTPKYYGILSVIRNKIIGNADIALESYNTPLDWKAISRCLTIHYADKRDLGTLEYQMTSLIQGKSSIQEFYQRVYTHLSLLLNKIACMEVSTESMRLLTETYRDKALDTFIRGLNGDLPRLLGIKEPIDLPQALHFCLKLENQNFRSNHANNHHVNHRKPPSNPPPTLPLRNHTNLRRQGVFYPELTYVPHSGHGSFPSRQQYPISSRPQYQSQQASAVPQRPNAPKPLPKPEPMDIDRSMQTNVVNYANRATPLKYAGKRGPIDNLNNRSSLPQKQQRNYHVTTEVSDFQTPQEHSEECFSYQQLQQQAENEDAYDQTLTEYVEEYYDDTQTSENEINNLADIHFLE